MAQRLEVRKHQGTITEQFRHSGGDLDRRRTRSLQDLETDPREGWRRVRPFAEII